MFSGGATSKPEILQFRILAFFAVCKMVPVFWGGATSKPCNFEVLDFGFFSLFVKPCSFVV